MKKVFKIMTLVLCIAVNNAFADEPNKYSNVIVFGDALSDVGNNNWLENSGQTGAPFTNEDTRHQHPLWIDMLVDSLIPGSKIYYSSQVQSLHVNPGNHSISYAWSSAESGANYLNDDQKEMPFPPYNDNICTEHGAGYIEKGKTCVPGVRQQVAQYLKDVDYHPNSNTVFILSGDNDLVNNLIKLMVSGRSIQGGLFAALSMEVKPGYTDLSYTVMNTLQAKNDLIDAGIAADHIFVLDTADFSQMPGFIKLEKLNPGILKLMHVVTLVYNANLNKAMINTNPKYDLPPSHIYSTYNFMNDVINNPSQFGFNNVTESCIDKNVGPLCEGYVFFNDGLPTVKLSQLFAEKMKSIFKD